MGKQGTEQYTQCPCIYAQNISGKEMVIVVASWEGKWVAGGPGVEGRLAFHLYIMNHVHLYIF